ncbi:MAG: hypothetical protein KDI33_19915 [Halioglobus sp.]|nr:hypothetical protein [Halioglobus sp.]
MNTSSFNLGRYSRLALLLLMLAAQGIAVAHDLGDGHGLTSHPCSSCIIGHGLGTAVNNSCETPVLQVHRAFAPVHAITATLAPRTSCHCARAPPVSPWNT